MMKNGILIITVVIMAALVTVGAFLFSPAWGNPSVVYIEAPLHKNMYFQPAPGDVFTYLVTMENSSTNATYEIYPGDGCTYVRLMESVNISGDCLDRSGMDTAGFNTTVGNPPLLMFQPWMLALNGNWTWNSTMFMSFNGALKEISQNSYRVIRLENYSGREAYVVELKSDNESPDYEWVDADERILLKMTGDGYEIDLENSS